MALYDNPPQVDPATGRLPIYKQVLQQDPATGVYKIKYEYTQINQRFAGLETPAETLQDMLTKPVDTFPGIGQGTGQPEDKTEDVVEDAVTTTAATTDAGGRGQGGMYDFQGGDTPFGDRGPQTNATTLDGLMNTAFPGVAARIFGGVATGFISSANPLLGTALSVQNRISRQNARDALESSLNDGSLAIGMTTSQIDSTIDSFKNVEDPLAKQIVDKLTNISRMSSLTPEKKPTQPSITGVAQDPFTGDASIAESIAAQDRLRDVDPAQIARDAQQAKDDAIAAGNIADARAAAMRESGYRGMSRDAAEAAADAASVSAGTNSPVSNYSGETITSFDGTQTQVGTFSDRRNKENEGRNEDGTAEEGSVADMRDIARTQTAPISRSVDRDNAVDNAARENEVSDRHGNAVTNNGKAINHDPSKNKKLAQIKALFSGKRTKKGGGGGGSGGGNGGSGGCFVKGTMIQMLNGTEKEITTIKVGEETKGGIVQAKMEFMPQSIYNYKGVLVSGSHWVVEDNQLIAVEDSKHGILTDRVEPVYTFKTSDNRIWINDIEFGDFETGTDEDWEPYFEKVRQDLNKKLRGEI